MPSIINQYYDYSLVMQASYALLDSSNLSKAAVQARLDDAQANFTTIQAQSFVDRFDAISHQANDSTGFSATLFRDTADNGQLVLQ